MRSLVARLRRALSSESFVGNVTIVAAGAAAAQAISIIFVPILTRLYGPQAFGVLAAFAAVVEVLTPVLSLRYFLAIAVTRSPRERHVLVLLSLGLVMVLVAATQLLWLLTSALFPSLDRALSGLTPYRLLFPVSLLAAGAYQVLTTWAVAESHFSSIARTRVTLSLSQVVIQTGMGLLRAGPIGLLLGDAAGRGSAALVLFSRWKREVNPSHQRVRAHEVGSTARKFRRFPLISSWSSLLTIGGVYVPTLLVTGIYGTEVGGWFGLGQRVYAIPMGLVGNAIAQVYVAHAAKLAAIGEARLKLFRETRRRLALVGILGTAVLVSGGPAFGLVFGARWREAGVFCSLLAPMLLAQFVASPLSATLDLTERQDLEAWWGAGRLLIVVAAFGTARALGLSPRGALILYGLAGAAAYGLLLLVMEHALKRPYAAKDRRTLAVE